jgi:DNA polymerase-3 subunit alpha
VGFYISSHPLKDFGDALNQYKVKTYSEFENSSDIESFISGTVMSIKERKTVKGTPFAIIKFSDLSKVFELFLFSEILEANRKNLIPGRSFIITVLKDKENNENRFRRINVRKIISLDELIKKNYINVSIEIDKSDSLKKLYENIKEKGDTVIKISIAEDNKNYLFELKDKRKFDYNTLKHLNQEPYIKKINI